ncbi:MAG: hypothetical protein ACKORG_06965 [Actinomycetota bacterium]
MNIRSRKITSLVLASSILATGAAGLGMSSAMAHDNGGGQTATRQDSSPGQGAQPGQGGQRGQGAQLGQRPLAVRAAVASAIAKAIGVTPDDIRAARIAGTSPATLAQQKGVARDTVVAAVVAALKANKPTGAPNRTDAQLTQMAERVVDNARPGPGAGGHGGHRR